MKSLLRSSLTAFTLLALASAAFAKPGWSDDPKKALEEAKRSRKLVLMDFTGSDWCSWCMKLDKEVFSQAKFKDYAKNKLVLVEVDFPRRKPLPKPKQEKNEELAKQYQIQGFPSVVVLNSEGKEVGRLGYQPGGAEAFIAELEKLAK